MSTTKSRVDSWFEISKRGSTVSQEVRGGLVTFFTMAYIIILNPLIIGNTTDKNGMLVSGLPKLDSAGEVIGANVGVTIGMVGAATAFIAGLLTILMGVVGRFPIGMATGLGLNALVAYVIAPTMTWPQAMGLVVWEGLLITILVLTGFRSAVFRAVPKSLRTGISVGIGLFITFVGLMEAGVVRKPAGPTPVELGINGSLQGWPIAVFLFGFLLVIVLHVKKVKGSMLISILVATVVAVIVESVLKLGPHIGDKNVTGWALNPPAVPSAADFTLPDLSLLGRVDLFGGFAPNGKFELNIVLGLLEVLLVDSIGAVAGGLGSVSSNTSYIESAAGVGEGARTGFSSVIAGAAFLVGMFVSPVLKMVPSEAAAPVLVFVGFLMMSQVVGVDWDDVEQGIPAFFTMILMPFTYSITVGIGAGFLMYVIIKIVRGKTKQVHPLMWLIAALFVIYFAQGIIASLI